MPYIGNSHIAGDHTNNFKVLDDITSYTETFDGTSASIVDTTNNTIRVPKHRFYQGQRVTYDKGGAGGTGPLTSISMVASAYGATPSSGPVQVTAPAGIQAGDLLIIMASCPNTSGIDANIPTGFTKIEDSENTVVDHRISYKIAVGNESGTTYSGQSSSQPNEGNMNIFVFRGNTSVTSVSVVNTYAWNTSGTGPSSVSVNAGTGDKALSIITTSSRSSNINTITPTAPATGWTNYDNINGTGNDEVQALSWNYHTRNGNVSANTTYGNASRATAIGCVLTVNGATGPTDIGGLTSGTTYFVSFDTNETIKLATSLGNANSNQVVNISSVAGSGTSHTLNNSFDGVNTKFKITHSGGNEVSLEDASQLTIAINNVLQRPSLNDGSFVEGFTVVDRKHIKFKNAPLSSDVFWGHVIAEIHNNFDPVDFKIDTFTGDGTTTEFNLSRIPPNNTSVLVTLDGVVQHPNDTDGAKAYNISSNGILFSSAPASGIDIQVRHTGFISPVTGNVTGFYGRTGNVTLSSNDTVNVGTFNAATYEGLKVEEGHLELGSLNGTFNYDLIDGHVFINPSATGGNYTPNFRVDSNTSLASKMNTGEVISVTLIVASSSHYCTNTASIDGSTSNITRVWVGGSPPSSANGSGYDIYSFTIIKTSIAPAYILIGNTISAA